MPKRRVTRRNANAVGAGRVARRLLHPETCHGLTCLMLRASEHEGDGSDLLPETKAKEAIAIAIRLGDAAVDRMLRGQPDPGATSIRAEGERRLDLAAGSRESGERSVPLDLRGR